MLSIKLMGQTWEVAPSKEAHDIIGFAIKIVTWLEVGHLCAAEDPKN